MRRRWARTIKALSSTMRKEVATRESMGQGSPKSRKVLDGAIMTHGGRVGRYDSSKTDTYIQRSEA